MRPEDPPEYAVDPRPRDHRPTYFPQLDGLRGLLATFVVFHHILLQVWPIYVERPTPAPSPLAWLMYGHFAVDAFIVLSGFVLSVPVVRDGGLARGVGGFYVGRFWRIIPTYMAALTLSLLLSLTVIGQKTGTHWDVSVPVDGWGLFAAATLTPDWFGSARVNHVFWSVAVETKIYLLFPALVWSWRRIGLPVTTIAVGFALGGTMVFLRKWLGHDPDIWINAHPWYLVLFLFGALAAQLATVDDTRWARWRHLPFHRIALISVAPVAAVAAWRGFDAIHRHLAPTDLLIGGAVALFLSGLIAQPGRVARVLQFRPLLWVGSISYSLYLIHAPLLQLIHQYLIFPWKFPRLGQFLALVGVGYPLILLASTLFFSTCERPFLPRRRLMAEAEELDHSASGLGVTLELTPHHGSGLRPEQ